MIPIENLIGSVGFPIAMCIWFMYRMEKLIKNNTVALVKIEQVVSSCNKKGKNGK